LFLIFLGESPFSSSNEIHQHNIKMKKKNKLCSAMSAIIIGASVFLWTANASAQYVPTWEQTGLYYYWYVDALTYSQGGQLSPSQAASIAGANGANAGAYAYYSEVAWQVTEPYYDAAWVQESYYRWYGAQTAAVAWNQGEAYQAWVFNWWSEYGESIAQWYYDYADPIYDYYSDIADYYFDLVFNS